MYELSMKRQHFLVVGVCLLIIGSHPFAGAGSGDVQKVSAAGVKSLVAKNKGKVVLVNYFATWCPPCVDEFPDLVKLQAKYKSRGLSVIGVSLNDSADEMDTLKAFIRKQKPSFPVYIASPLNIAFCRATDKRWEGDIPLTIIFDRSGKQRLYRSGPRTLAQFEADIKPLLAKP